MSIGTGNGGFTGLVEVQGIAALNQPEGWGIGHAPLSMPDHDGQSIPVLAEQLPSLEDGTWLVNPDGTMRVTWRLRRNVRWHDGTPMLELIMRDDGCGIGSAPRLGRGLLGMQERAQALAGACTIDGARDRGTTLRVTIPLTPRSGLTNSV